MTCFFLLRKAGLAAVAMACWVIGSVGASAQGIGLYKDGVLVEMLGAPLNLIDPAQAALAERGDPTAKAALQTQERIAQVRPAEPSADAATRNAAAVRCAQAEARLRALLGELKAGDASEVSLEALRGLATELASAFTALQGALAQTELRLLQTGAQADILARHDAATTTIEKNYASLARAIDRILAGEAGALDAAIALAGSMAPPPAPPLAGRPPTIQFDLKTASRLTRQEADALLAAAPPPPAPPPSLPTPADSAATVEVQLTPEIMSKAAALGNSPVAIYDFVRNRVRFQPYLGSRKGAVETLRQLHGNDTDQASLLLALLRAAGIPCRYVRGTVEMTPERAKSWLAVEDAATAGSILTTAGMDGLSIVNGSTVTAIRCTRVWVEAYLPYSNYRGRPNETTGKTWVPLDPAFTLSEITPGQDVLTAMGFNTDAFLADYISTFHALSPVEKFVADIQTYLDTAQPGTSVAQVERTSEVAAQVLGLLPASLPYQVRAISSRFSELEDAKRYKVRFRLYNGGTTFIDYTTNLSQIISGAVTIDYIGATASDQATIASYGGIYETPPNLVNVKPRLKLDGTPLVTSTNAIGMGRSHSSDMQFFQPSGASNVQPLVQNTISAGNTQAIAFDTFLDERDAFFFGGNPALSLLEAELHSTAVGYLSRVDRGEEQVERLMQVVTTQDVSEAIVESSVSIAFSFGVPVTFEWTGLIVDADRRIVGPFAVNGDPAKKVPYMFLTGYDGSTMENRIFEDTYAQQAVSTIKILELSRDQGIPVFRIVTSIAADAPGLSQPASVVSAINAALAQGHHVIIPRTGITVGNWSGTGYIDLNPTTGAAGYIISGGISSGVSTNGGATVESWPVFLPCLNPTVSNDPGDPIKSYSTEAPSTAVAVFSGGDTHKIILKGKFRVVCPGKPAQSQPFNKTMSLKISEIAATYGPGEYTLSLLTTVFLQLTIFDIKIDSVDANFAPGVEQLEVKYSVRPSGFSAPYAKIEAFKSADMSNSLFKDDTISKSGTMVVFKWDGKANQGADSGKYSSPENSPFNVRASADAKASFANAAKDEKSTKIEVESLVFNINAATEVIMNDPEHKEEVSVLVKLKKKDGTGAATAVPIQVSYSFSDPGTANTAKNDSYEYAGGKFLGKKDDGTAIHWEDHAKSDSDSTDGFKLVCRAKTVEAAGADQGKAFISFKPSGVGADDFKLKGVVKHTDGADLKSEESGVLAVWRQVSFNRIYEMDGETHVSSNATEAKIQPYFTPAFVDYVVGAVNAIPVAKSVKYIGLWNNTAPHQDSWATLQTKVAAVNYTLLHGPHAGAVVTTEVPTATELADAAGPAGPAQTAAREAITKKAQAWVERIDAGFSASLSAWNANGGITNDSLTGIKHYHPKYSKFGGDDVTNEWPSWVLVTTYHNSYPNRDPDALWVDFNGFGGLSHGSGIITIPKGFPASTVERAVAHEAGHASKASFKREDFGPMLDHSATAGLMDPNQTQAAFTAREKKVLQGIKP